MPNKIKRLKDIVTILNDGVTKEEFLKSFKSALNQIAKVEKKLIERNDTKTSETQEDLKRL